MNGCFAKEKEEKGKVGRREERRCGDGSNILALYGSSFFRTPFTAQSNIEKSPPKTAKLPPSTGARAFIAVSAPIRRSPYGLFRKPLTPCQIVPPIA
jgi:hypothetical protein